MVPLNKSTADEIKALLYSAEQYLASENLWAAEIHLRKALWLIHRYDHLPGEVIYLNGWILLHLMKLKSSQNLFKLEEYAFAFTDLYLPEHGEQELHDAGVDVLVRCMESNSPCIVDTDPNLPTFSQILIFCLGHPCTKPSPLYSRILRVILHSAQDYRYLFSEVGRWDLSNLMEEDYFPNPDYQEEVSLFDKVQGAISAKAAKEFAESRRKCSEPQAKSLAKAEEAYRHFNEFMVRGNLEKASAALMLLQTDLEDFFVAGLANT